MKSQAKFLLGYLIFSAVVLVAQQETQLHVPVPAKGVPDAKVEEKTTPEGAAPQTLDEKIQQVKEAIAQKRAENQKRAEELASLKNKIAGDKKENQQLVFLANQQEKTSAGFLHIIKYVFKELVIFMIIGMLWGFFDRQRKRGHESRIAAGKAVTPLPNPQGSANPLFWIKVYFATVGRKLFGFNQEQAGSSLFRWLQQRRIIKLLKLEMQSETSSEFALVDSWCYQYGLPALALSFLLPMLLKVTDWQAFFARGLIETFLIFSGYALAALLLWCPYKYMGWGNKWNLADHLVACIRPSLPIFLAILAIFYDAKELATVMEDFSVTMIVETVTSNVATIVIACAAFVMASTAKGEKGSDSGAIFIVKRIDAETRQQPLMKAIVLLVALYIGAITLFPLWLTEVIVLCCKIVAWPTVMLMTIGAGRGLVLAALSPRNTIHKPSGENNLWAKQLQAFVMDGWLIWVSLVSLIFLPLYMLYVGKMMQGLSSEMTQGRIELLSLFFAVCCSINAYLLIKKCKGDCDHYYPAMLYLMGASVVTLVILINAGFYPTISG